MPQALVCLEEEFRLQTLLDPSKKLSKENVGAPTIPNVSTVLPSNIITSEGGEGGVFTSNGNHLFSSFDRIAVAQALNYRVPLVFYDQKNSSHEKGAGGSDKHGLRGLLFIDKSLADEAGQIERAFTATKKKWEPISKSFDRGRRGLRLLDVFAGNDPDNFDSLNKLLGKFDPATITQKGDEIEKALTHIDIELPGDKSATGSMFKPTEGQLLDATLRHYLAALFSNIVVLKTHAQVAATSTSIANGSFVERWNSTIRIDKKIKGGFLEEPFSIIPEFITWVNQRFDSIETYTDDDNLDSIPWDDELITRRVRRLQKIVGVVSDYCEDVRTFSKLYESFDRCYSLTMKPLIDITKKPGREMGHVEYKKYSKKHLPWGMYDNIKRIRPHSSLKTKDGFYSLETHSVVGSVVGQYTVLKPIIEACKNTPLRGVNVAFEERITKFFDGLIERVNSGNRNPRRNVGMYDNLRESAKGLFLRSIGKEISSQMGGNR